jgi:hypothetical protein
MVSFVFSPHVGISSPNLVVHRGAPPVSTRLTDTEGVHVAIDETDVAWPSDEEPPGCG